MDPFAPIHAFKKHTFPELFKWNADQIMGFLNAVATKPSDFGALDTFKTQFEHLRDEINSLRAIDNPPTSSAGKKYRDPKPGQQFLRGGNPLQVMPTNPVPWPANNTAKQYFIIFDLLGAFLSLMGPAPKGATAKDYFLPLVVIYTRWCLALGRGVKTNPTVTQITWGINGKNEEWCFIGSSAAGFNQKPADYKTLVRKTRHDYISPALRAPYMNIEDSPEKDKNRNSGNTFGNCGETYPFLYILWDPALNLKCSGIALEVGKVDEIARAHLNEYHGKPYWAEFPNGAMKGPCSNCEQLMDWYGVLDRLEAFKLWMT